MHKNKSSKRFGRYLLRRMQSVIEIITKKWRNTPCLRLRGLNIAKKPILFLINLVSMQYNSNY